MENYVASLRHCPLFENIRTEDLTKMLGCLSARELRVKKGQFILREGDSTRMIGIVLSGAAQVIREDYYGNRSIMARIEPLQLFGESYAFSGVDVLPVSIVAHEDSHILMVDSQRITSCCSHACSFHHQMIFNLLHLVSTHNLMLHQKMQITAKRTTRDKLMAYLLIQAKQAGKNIFTIPYDRQGLADYLEVDRSGLSAELSKLRKEGILESEKSTFKLL